MEPNTNEEPNVKVVKTGEDYVVVETVGETHAFYKYTYAASGESVVEEIKRLAKQGHGLAAYVNTPSVKNTYGSMGDSAEL